MSQCLRRLSIRPDSLLRPPVADCDERIAKFDVLEALDVPLNAAACPTVEGNLGLLPSAILSKERSHWVIRFRRIPCFVRLIRSMTYCPGGNGPTTFSPAIGTWHPPVVDAVRLPVDSLRGTADNPVLLLRGLVGDVSLDSQLDGLG